MKELNERLKSISNNDFNKLYPEFPKKNLLIEVTNKCNCNCVFCANSKMKRKRKFIDEKLVNKVLIEAYDLGMREVGFYTTGESLLDDNLCNYIKKAKSVGYKYVYITTNAILLNKSKIIELIESGLDSIKLSINAINSKDYKFIHGVDYYDVVMNNLKELYNYRKDNDLKYKIYVSYISTRYTDYEIDTIKNNFNKYCDEVAIVNVRNQSGLMPEIKDYLSCKDSDNKIQAERVLPCHYTFETVTVSCEGYLTACCTDFENYLAYADLNKCSLKDAWTNSVITELRRKQLNNELGDALCNNCINNSYCLPKPLVNEYIEKEITQSTFAINKVKDRLEK